MIEDRRIDLTLNGDFKHSLECSDLDSSNINSFRATSKRTLIGEYGYEKIPWRYHEFGQRKYENINNDYFSGEYGADIYFTSENHIFITDDEDSRYGQMKTSHLNAVMEEFFMEVVGYMPNTLEKYCYRCGHRFLDYNGEFECEDCRNEWKYNQMKRTLFDDLSDSSRRVPW